MEAKRSKWSSEGCFSVSCFSFSKGGCPRLQQLRAGLASSAAPFGQQGAQSPWQGGCLLWGQAVEAEGGGAQHCSWPPPAGSREPAQEAVLSARCTHPSGPGAGGTAFTCAPLRPHNNPPGTAVPVLEGDTEAQSSEMACPRAQGFEPRECGS